ncbi:MAG: hypothetical protein K0S39_6270, partial [Paenibacillus sp.]|nr:hypothetical protein [Paenibacillus sp.]
IAANMNSINGTTSMAIYESNNLILMDIIDFPYGTQSGPQQAL